MPTTWGRRIRPAVSRSHSQRSLKFPQRKYFSFIQFIKVFAAILVPLMIGAFTVVTTLQESNGARSQREAELTRIEREGQLQQAAEERQRTADQLKSRDEQGYRNRAAEELRSEQVYDSFMRDISPIVLKPNGNLTMVELLFVRSKTLLTLDQIDLKRKWYLTKFLYDSQLLYVRDMGYVFVDLAAGDLSHVKFGSAGKIDRKINLEKIRLSSMDLFNTSFNNVILRYARFDYSDLNHSSFYMVSFFSISFIHVSLENSKFFLTQLQNISFAKCNLRRTTWTFKRMEHTLRAAHVDYSDADASEARFEGLSWGANIRFSGTILDLSEFIDHKFSPDVLFNNVSLKMARFSRVIFDQVTFVQSNMSGASFEQCEFWQVRFDHVDLQKTRFDGLSSSSKIEFHRVNLNSSTFNISYKNHFKIMDSFLPNGTFTTSFQSLGVNLIRNGDAEHGECYTDLNKNFSNSIAPPYWSSEGQIIQIRYNASDWKLDVEKSGNQSCLFFGVDQRANKITVLRQEFNVSQLAMLIDTRRTRYEASAYLGGFGNEPCETRLKVTFRKEGNGNDPVTVGKYLLNERDPELFSSSAS